MTGENLRRFLAASVLLNVFLAGGIAGGAWRWWTTERPASQAALPQRSLRYAANDLPADEQQAYHSRLRDARASLSAAITSARDSRREVMRLMVAPSFDRSATEAALARTRELDMVQRARYESAVVDFAAALAPPQRQLFAAGLAQSSNLAPKSPASSRR